MTGRACSAAATGAVTAAMTGATGAMTAVMTGATGAMTGKMTGAIAAMTDKTVVAAGQGCSGNGELDLFFAHGISLGEPAGSADVDVEEVQQPGLDAGGFGDHGGVAVVGGDQPQVGEGLEDGPAGGSGGGGAVAGQAGYHLAVGAQGFADLPLGQAEDQQGQADHGDQGSDAAVGLQEQGGDREGAFELAVAAFDGVLALVAAETSAGSAWPGSRLVSRAYQPSAAASASIAAWSKCQDSTGLPAGSRVIAVCAGTPLTRRWVAIAVTRAATAPGVG